MNNRLIELLVTVIVVVALAYVLSLLLPIVGLPPVFANVVYVLVLVVAVVWLLRSLKKT